MPNFKQTFLTAALLAAAQRMAGVVNADSLPSSDINTSGNRLPLTSGLIFTSGVAPDSQYSYLRHPNHEASTPFADAVSKAISNAQVAVAEGKDGVLSELIELPGMTFLSIAGEGARARLAEISDGSSVKPNSELIKIIIITSGDDAAEQQQASKLLLQFGRMPNVHVELKNINEISSNEVNANEAQYYVMSREKLQQHRLLENEDLKNVDSIKRNLRSSASTPSPSAIETPSPTKTTSTSAPSVSVTSSPTLGPTGQPATSSPSTASPTGQPVTRSPSTTGPTVAQSTSLPGGTVVSDAQVNLNFFNFNGVLEYFSIQSTTKMGTDGQTGFKAQLQYNNQNDPAYPLYNPNLPNEFINFDLSFSPNATLWLVPNIASNNAFSGVTYYIVDPNGVVVGSGTQTSSNFSPNDPSTSLLSKITLFPHANTTLTYAATDTIPNFVSEPLSSAAIGGIAVGSAVVAAFALSCCSYAAADDRPTTSTLTPRMP